MPMHIFLAPFEEHEGQIALHLTNVASIGARLLSSWQVRSSRSLGRLLDIDSLAASCVNRLRLCNLSQLLQCKLLHLDFHAI